MGTKHKHYDVIVAWAAGEEIEFKRPGHLWQYAGQSPTWGADNEYRIKPKRVKKEGWVNVYADGILGFKVYQTEEEAYKQRDKKSRLFCACIRIEWEEEE